MLVQEFTRDMLLLAIWAAFWFAWGAVLGAPVGAWPSIKQSARWCFAVFVAAVTFALLRFGIAALSSMPLSIVIIAVLSATVGALVAFTGVRHQTTIMHRSK